MMSTFGFAGRQLRLGSWIDCFALGAVLEFLESVVVVLWQGDILKGRAGLK